MTDYALELRNALPTMSDRDREFATSLLKGFEKWHSFTDKQLYWVKKLLAGGDKPTTLAGNLVPFATMFQLAMQHLKRPRIRLISEAGNRFYVYPAGANSKNAGWFYVKATGMGGTYYGKVHPKTGEFIKSAECPDDVLATLNTFAGDPKQAATAYGHRTNSCCFCGQTLTDSVSVQLGYGPICAGHYGLPH